MGAPLHLRRDRLVNALRVIQDTSESGVNSAVVGAGRQGVERGRPAGAGTLKKIPVNPRGQAEMAPQAGLPCF